MTNGDYISRQKVERFIENGLNNPDKKKAFGHDAVEILTEVHYMDSADVQPVVYCVDCRYWVKQKATVRGYCKLSGRYPSGGWWCADGDRREGGTP